jgi:hypothetical protein
MSADPLVSLRVPNNAAQICPRSVPLSNVRNQISEWLTNVKA